MRVCLCACLLATGCSSIPFIGPTATSTPVAPAIAGPGLTNLSVVIESQEANQLYHAQLLAIAPPVTGHAGGRIVVNSGAWMSVITEDGRAVQRISQYPMCDGLNPYIFSVSPDRQWVACNHAAKSVLLGQLDSTSLQLVGEMETAFTTSGFAGITWAPDSHP